MARYLSEIWKLRYFWLSLVRIDLRSRYRRSILGVGWSLLNPILMTIVLCFVFGALFQEKVRDFAPYLLTGLVAWNFFFTAIMHGCQSFMRGESYIRQHPAPMAIYPLRTTLEAGTHFLLGLAVVLTLVWSLKGFGNVPVLYGVIPVLAMMFVFGWAMGILTGVINVLFHDWQHILEVLMQVLFYGSAVIYRPELLESRNLGWVVHANPIANMIYLVRQPIEKGTIADPQYYLFALLATCISAVLAVVVLAKMERRIIFYL